LLVCRQTTATFILFQINAYMTRANDRAFLPKKPQVVHGGIRH